MILWTFQETARSSGGGPISCVSDFVSYQEVNFGIAIRDLKVTVYSNPENIGKGPISKLRSNREGKTHDVFTPSVVFRRKEKTLRIKWQSRNLSEDEMEVLGWQNVTTSIFNRAVQDVYDALNWGLNEYLSERDDFDISGCLDWVKAAQNNAPANDDNLRSILSARSKLYVHLIRTKHFHQKIDIDWSLMHEDAAYLLYHPELWNDTDPRMPHGNVWGKAILSNFDYYKKMSVGEILSGFKMDSYEDAATYDGKIKALQVELALVFAHIKKNGFVSDALVDALIRQLIVEAENEKSFWVYRSRHGVFSHFSWMCDYLEAFTNIKRPSFL